MVRPASRSPGGDLNIPLAPSAKGQDDANGSSSPLSSPISIAMSISSLPIRNSDRGKRRLSFEEPKENKRLRYAAPNSEVDTATINIHGCLETLRQALPAKFGRHFERLMYSNTAATDDWTLPAHHRFMAALCQSVQDCIDEFRFAQDIHTLASGDVDALFQQALGALGKLSAKSDEQTPLNRFLADPEHAAYREIVENPQRFDVRTAETEAAFANAMHNIRHLVRGYNEDASEMWKLCIDPQTIALLRVKNIDTADPLVGRFVFEGEKHFLHNMAQGWGFIADAAVKGRKLTPGLLDEINAICTGRPAAASNILEAGGTGFAILQGHTASPRGLKKLEETVASLQAQGLDVELLKKGKYQGTDLDYYELQSEVSDEHDAGLLQDWTRKCIDEHQARAKDLQGDELALNDLELAIKLNQAHIFPDGNIRTCHLLLNFLRLSRGEKPFMFAEPNVMDAHMVDELLQKMKAALVNRVDLPTHPVKTPMQAALLSQIKQRETPIHKPKRNIPRSREYLALIAKAYQAELESAAKMPAGDGSMLISNSNKLSWTSAANSLIRKLSAEGMDVEELQGEALEVHVTAYLDSKYPLSPDGKTSPARDSMKNYLDAYQHWRNTGWVQLRKGAIVALTREEQDLVRRNQAHAMAYQKALELAVKTPTGDGKMMITETNKHDWGSHANTLIKALSILRLDAETLQGEALDVQVTAHLDRKYPSPRDDKTSLIYRNVKSHLGAYQYWCNTGLVRLQRGAVMALTDKEQQIVQRNQAHAEAYQAALTVAAETPMGDGKMMISELNKRDWSASANTLIKALSTLYVDVTALDGQALEAHVTAHLDKMYGLHPDAKTSKLRTNMKGLLDAYLHWRDTGSVQLRKGAIIASTEEAQQIVQHNQAHLERYKTDLDLAAQKPAGDGKMMITKENQKAWGGAADKLISVLSSKGVEASVLKGDALNMEVTTYLDSNYPLAAGEKASGARYNMKSKLEAYQHWCNKGSVRLRKGAVVALTEEAQQIVRRNQAHVKAYHEALDEMMISDSARKNFGGAVNPLITALGTLGIDATTLKGEALDTQVTAYLNSRHPLSPDGKASPARVTMKSYLDAYQNWCNNGSS